MKTDRLGVALATWCGVGYFPIAPGTAGALAAMAVAYALVVWCGAPMWSLAAVAVALIPAGAWSARAVERRTGLEDPKFVVVDEVIGQWLALAAARADVALDWWIAFALFRFFDVVKPPPIRSLERFGRGWGVIADDVGAGLCAMMFLTLYRWWSAGG
jgi:phosphatidylglycerophosphatase A